jgi:hypothetical protein
VVEDHDYTRFSPYFAIAHKPHHYFESALTFGEMQDATFSFKKNPGCAQVRTCGFFFSSESLTMRPRYPSFLMGLVYQGTEAWLLVQHATGWLGEETDDFGSC